MVSTTNLEIVGLDSKRVRIQTISPVLKTTAGTFKPKLSSPATEARNTWDKSTEFLKNLYQAFSVVKVKFETIHQSRVSQELSAGEPRKEETQM